MKQILHIIRKDVRHHWIEVVLSLAALVAYSAHEVRGWRLQGVSGGAREFWSIVLPVLIPLTWWFLIVRLIQGETLVGDRQFWITRPYEWKKLLAAKAVFIVMFISVPSYLAGVFLLIMAGFNPAHYLIGLAWMQLYLIVVPLLPMVALASVTRNITQSLLALLAVVSFMAGMVALEANLPQSSLPLRFDSDWLQGAVVAVASVLVIGLQYVRRKTALSRALLAGAAIMIALIQHVTPYVAQGERLFPLAPSGSQSPLRAVLDPKKSPPATEPPDKDEEIEIAIPIITSGLPGNLIAHVNGVKLSLQARDGFQWDSRWESYYAPLLPQESHWRAEFKMDNNVFQRLNRAPIKADVSLAFTVFRRSGSRRIKAMANVFAVPGVGLCWIDVRDASSIRCRSPLTRPNVLMTAEPAASTCPPLKNEKELPPTGAVAYDWEWGSDDEYGINPVESFGFYLSNFPVVARICPGTPLNLVFPEMMERRRAEFEVTDLKLDDYRVGRFGGVFQIVPETPKK